MKTSFWLLAALCFLPAQITQAANITFDFDTGVPSLFDTQNLPIDQQNGGLTAKFRSIAGFDGFSIQSDGSTGFALSQFSGHYIYPNSNSPGALDILFTQPLKSITLWFATNDATTVEVPTSILLTAFVDSTATPPTGFSVASGVWSTDTFPMGTITFNSGGQAFNLVEITIPLGQGPDNGSGFFIDNILVVTAEAPPPPEVPEPSGYASMSLGLLSLALLVRRLRTAR